jgi:hypothetical protein
MGFTLPLLKKPMTEGCSSLVHVSSGAAIFPLLLRSRVAFLHRTATLQPMSNTVNLQDNRGVFQIFIALLRFSFESPSYYLRAFKMTNSTD